MVDPTFSFGGISSGLDTASIIDQLMQLEAQPIRRYEAEQRSLRSVDAAWSTIVGKLSAFRAAVDEVAAPGALARLTTASSSDESAVRVTPQPGGDPGSVSFTVEALAQRHRVAFDERFGSASASVSAGSMTFTDETGGTLATLTIDGTETVADLAAAIDALDIGIDAQVLKVTDSEFQLVLTASDTGAQSSFGVTTDVAELGTAVQLSAGSDARLRMGALSVTRSSNTIDDLIEGATVELKAVTTADVSVTVDTDDQAIVDAVTSMVTTANDVLKRLKQDMAYDTESGTAGILQGDSLARDIAFGLRSTFTQTVDGGDISYAGQLGIALTRDGEITLDEDELREAVARDPAAVQSFFAASLTGDPGVDLEHVGPDAVAGTFTATVTQDAAVATATSGTYAAPLGSPLTFTIDTPAGRNVTVTIDEGMTAEQAAARIRAALGDDDSLTVGVVPDDLGVGEVLSFASTGFGSAKRFTIAGYGVDLDGTYAGTDVVADFGQGPVTGSGRSISGDGAAEGLTFSITGGVGTYELGFGRGFAGALDAYLARLEGTDGRIQVARDSISGAITDYDEQIEAFQRRLDLREATIRRQFTTLETTLGRLQSQGQWLAGALGGVAPPSSR